MGTYRSTIFRLFRKSCGRFEGIDRPGSGADTGFLTCLTPLQAAPPENPADDLFLVEYGSRHSYGPARHSIASRSARVLRISAQINGTSYPVRPTATGVASQIASRGSCAASSMPWRSSRMETALPLAT